MEFIKRVFQSYTSDKNKGITGVTTLAGLYCGLHISTLPVGDLVIWKIVASIVTLVFLPAVGVFLTDLYTLKIKPKIFKNKHRY